MTVRVYSDQAGTTAAAANDNIGKVEDLSKFDSDGVSSTTGPYLSVDANGFGSADILAQGGDVVQTFTNAIADGSALVVGTSKCIFFSNVNVEAGGTLTIGPAGDMINTNGLSLIGKVVSVATTTKVLTTAEQNSIATFFAERGASSVVVNDETVYDENGVEADVVLDFTGDSFYRNVPHYFKLGGTYTTFADAFTGTSPKLTYSTTSNSTMVNSAGEIVWAPHNLLDYSDDLVNGATAYSSLTIDSADTFTFTANTSYIRLGQITGAATKGKYTARAYISGNTPGDTFNIELVDDADGSDSNTSNVTVSATPQWVEVTADFSGSSTFSGTLAFYINRTSTNRSITAGSTVTIKHIHLYRSDLGGMAQVPGAATGFEYYVPTSGSAEYLPRVGHHVYNGSTWVNEGLLIESEPRSNLEINSNSDDPASYSRVGLDYTGQTLRTTGPDGVADSMFKLQEDTANSTHRLSSSITASVGTNTFSCVVKDAGHGRWVYWRTNNDGADQWINVNPATGEVTEAGTAVNDYGVIDLGNGFYRLWFSCDSSDGSSGWLLGSSNTATPGNSIPSFTGTLEAGFYCGFFQVEAGSTPSSYMPTSGGTYTRTAQSLTVPPAEFGWPEPEYIGPELVTNGDFATGDLTGWTGSATYQEVSGNGTAFIQRSADSTVDTSLDLTGNTTGKVLHVTFDVVQGSGNLLINEVETVTATSGQSYSFLIATTAQNNAVVFRARCYAGGSANIDNISVREINPLAVSIQMDGRMTYADEDSGVQHMFHRWQADGDNRLNTYLDTSTTRTGSVYFYREANNVGLSTFKTSTTTYSPGINVPFNFAVRHGSTFVNGATDGTALTADTTPTALPDLSGTDLQIAYDFMGTIGTFRQFAGDIGDAGLVTATNPSTEPTLSLNFGATATGSFYNLSWSE